MSKMTRFPAVTLQTLQVGTNSATITVNLTGTSSAPVEGFFVAGLMADQVLGVSKMLTVPLFTSLEL